MLVSLRSAVAVCGALALAAVASFASKEASARAKFKVLYSFTGGKDGDFPAAGLVTDNAGNLYGTTFAGGAQGYGTVFSIGAGGTETVLHSFAGGSDGINPYADLIRDKAGNLFGTTIGGGTGTGCDYGECGTAFKISSDGTEAVLHSFKVRNGTYLRGGLIGDKSGNLYGTAIYGGEWDEGSLFEISPMYKIHVLHSFGPSDGLNPVGNLTRDLSGDVYGVTFAGGLQGDGTVFKLAPNGSEMVLHSFGMETDGRYPQGLIGDSSGYLYGTTEGGGGRCDCGIVFQVAPDGTETVLHSFMGGSDGFVPLAGLTRDEHGNLYGTTSSGGGSTNCEYGCGTIFKIATDGTELVLHSFDGKNGSAPASDLVEDKNGNLYGTTELGGAYGYGTVFRLTE